MEESGVGSGIGSGIESGGEPSREPENCRPDRPLSETRLKKCNIAPNIIIAVESKSGSWLTSQHITGIVSTG